MLAKICRVRFSASTPASAPSGRMPTWPAMKEKPVPGRDFRQVAVPPERRGDGFGTPAAWLHTAMIADRLGQVVCSQIWFAK
jgi:hypothetical protein